MYLYERLGVLFYVIVICATGYLGVSTLKGLWSSANAMDRMTQADSNRTVLTFDVIEPTSGE